jgi:hypothetical protein
MSNKYKILVGAGVFGAFLLGSTLGDDLLESLGTPQKESLGELFEERGEPINPQEIKMIAKKVMSERGYDTSKIDDLKGMTTDDGYIITALYHREYVATCFIHKDLEHVELSRKE